jgi:hypothetical protein
LIFSHLRKHFAFFKKRTKKEIPSREKMRTQNQHFTFNSGKYCWGSQSSECQRCHKQVPELLVETNGRTWEAYSIPEDAADGFTCIFCRLHEDYTQCMNCVAYGRFREHSFEVCGNCMSDKCEMNED